MRELSVNEVKSINGRGIAEFAGEGAAIGTLVGAILEGGASGVARGGAFGGLMGASFGAGYTIATVMGAGGVGSRLGKWLYDAIH